MNIRTDNRSPSLPFALLLLVGALGLHILLLRVAHQDFAQTAASRYDNPLYLDIAKRLRPFDFRGFEPTHFWGFPVAIALVSMLLRIPDISALILICFAAGALTVYFSYRLYGGFVAALFAIGSHFWLTFCLEGGSETPFAALTYAGLLTLRREKWILSGVLLGLAITVRPAGILALLCAGGTLLVRRKTKELALTATPAAAIGVSYLVLLYLATGDPFVNFTSYSRIWGGGSWPFSWPFLPVIRGFPVVRWTTMVEQLFWITLTAIALLAMCFGRAYRSLWREHPIEASLGIVFILFHASFNRLEVGGIDARLMGPIFPLMLLSFGRWAQWPRPALIALGMVNAMLSAFAMAGMRNVVGFGLP